MAKLKRNVVGSVYKPKPDPATGKPKPNSVDYIKMRDGKTYRLESAAYQLKSLEDAVKAGKLSEDVAEQVRERINKTPDFVRFEIVELVEQKE